MATKKIFKQIRAEEISEKLGISLSAFYRLVEKTVDFPPPVRFSSRWVAWFECEVDAWILRQAASQRGEDARHLLQHLVEESRFVEVNLRTDKRRTNEEKEKILEPVSPVTETDKIHSIPRVSGRVRKCRTAKLSPVV